MGSEEWNGHGADGEDICGISVIFSGSSWHRSSVIVDIPFSLAFLSALHSSTGMSRKERKRHNSAPIHVVKRTEVSPFPSFDHVVSTVPCDIRCVWRSSVTSALLTGPCRSSPGASDILKDNHHVHPTDSRHPRMACLEILTQTS